MVKTRYLIATVVFLTFTVGATNLMARDMSSKRFSLDSDGGEITIEAYHSSDTQTRDAVREQLQRDVRGPIPSATPALKQHQKEIKYKYEKTRAGGRIRMVAKSPEAVEAVQDFLRLQIRNSRNAKTVPFSFVEGTSLIVVPVMLNDRGPYRFLLDTGASNSILSTAVADKLKIPNGQPKTLLSPGGNVPATLRTIDAVQIGDTELDKVDIAVSDFGLLRALQVDGILGADYLRRFRISIDYNNQLVEIEPWMLEPISMLAA